MRHPVLLASQHGKPDALCALVRGGADVDESTNHGMRPLHNAARGGHSRCIDVLCEGGAKVDAREQARGTSAPHTHARPPTHAQILLQTPLAMAASAGHVDCAAALLGHGARATVYDVNGWRPYTHALFRGHMAAAAAIAAAVARGANERAAALAADKWREAALAGRGRGQGEGEEPSRRARDWSMDPSDFLRKHGMLRPRLPEARPPASPPHPPLNRARRARPGRAGRTDTPTSRADRR